MNSNTETALRKQWRCESDDHRARMDAGCLKCRAAAFGRVCPYCYVCRTCGPGCDECVPCPAAGG